MAGGIVTVLVLIGLIIIFPQILIYAGILIALIITITIWRIYAKTKKARVPMQQVPPQQWPQSHPAATDIYAPHPDLTYQQQPFASQSDNVNDLDEIPERLFVKTNLLTKKWSSACAKRFVVIDFETTGFNPNDDQIIEIAAIRYVNKEPADIFTTLINPERPIPKSASRVNGITDDMVQDAPVIESVISDLITFIGGDIIVAHNAPFDLGFLHASCCRADAVLENRYIDTLTVSRKLFPDLKNHKLITVAEHVKFSGGGIEWHRAAFDAAACASIVFAAIEFMEEKAREQIGR